MRLTFEKLRSESVQKKLVDSCVDILAHSYADPQGLFNEGLEMWDWLMVAKNEDHQVVGFQGWSVHSLQLERRTVWTVRMRIGAINPECRGIGLSGEVHIPIFKAGLADAAAKGGQSGKYPDTFGWGVLISPYSFFATRKIFTPHFSPDPEGKSDSFAAKAALAIQNEVFQKKLSDQENPFVLRNCAKFKYNEAETAKVKESLRSKPVAFFDNCKLSVENGDRILIVFGLGA